MIVVAILPAVVCIVGLLVYLLASNPKAVELGRLAFFAGLFCLTWALAGHTVRVG